ncbi:MAG: MFS transporter [Actinomycetota bacterium]|nr:MFS transporter [Actinomycetota bacterium]
MVTAATPGDPEPGPSGLHLHRWRSPVVIGIALAAFASGFGQFGAVAALGDVARSFGRVAHGATISDQAGLSGTELGIGLAVIRLASLGGLPVAGLADRFGRRAVLLLTTGTGLALTVAAAASPGYWWFVAIFACGRPFLSATNAVSQVAAAEHTGSSDRAKAVALVTAGYGVGAGATAVLHSLASSTLGFRGIFALAVVPLALLPLVARWVSEPDRFVVAAASDHALPVLGPVGPRFRGRLALLAVLAFGIAVVTGPANSFTFLYAQNVLRLPGTVTAAMVVGAGVAGLGGLLAGRWLADRLGRRPTAAIGVAGMAACGVLAYSGSSWALVTGYVAGVLAGSVFAPAGGAMVNELFPTPVRASVAGWWVLAGVIGAAAGLVVFGAIADAGNRFGVAALVTFLPAVAVIATLAWLPETRGREPEDLWPDTEGAR